MNKPIKVLVVDDEPVFARNIVRLLEERGFTAEAVFDGASAVTRVKERAGFDAVLLDYRMPGMDGLETLRRMKSRDTSPEIILLTGHATLEAGVEAIRLGAFDFLIKPCDIETLVDKLRQVGEVERIRESPVLWKRTRTEDILLYSFIRLHPEDNLTRAVEIFNRNRIIMAAETLFVTGQNDALLGTVTLRNLIGAVGAGGAGPDVTWDFLRNHPERLPDIMVGGIMTRGSLSAAPDMPLDVLGRLMMENRLRSLPVVEDGRMVGMVRLRDALKYL